MAPHDTNTPKEVRRHSVPLIGLGVLLLIVLGGFLWWIAYAAQGPAETNATPTEEVPNTTATQPTQ